MHQAHHTLCIHSSIQSFRSYLVTLVSSIFHFLRPLAIMRTTSLMVALEATFNLAFAHVICKSEALHYKLRITTAAEKAGLLSLLTSPTVPTRRVKLSRVVSSRLCLPLLVLGRALVQMTASCIANTSSMTALLARTWAVAVLPTLLWCSKSLSMLRARQEKLVKRTTNCPTVKKPAERKPALKTTDKTGRKSLCFQAWNKDDSPSHLKRGRGSSLNRDHHLSRVHVSTSQ